MSPLDAPNLLLFKSQCSYPICNIHYKKNASMEYSILFKNLFISNEKQTNYDLQAQSISSLIHFGLVEIPPHISFSDKSKYNDFESNIIYNMYKTSVPTEIGSVTLEKKKIDITPLGESFINICL